MIKKPNLSKIFIVVFLTILIWVWADLAQDDTVALRNLVTITVSRSTSTDPMWITFNQADQLQNSVTLETVELTGPASRVADVGRLQNEGNLELDLFVNPDQVGLTESGTREFDVLNFLKQSEDIRRLGLAVENCEPRNLSIQVRKLVSKPSLRVECLDQNGNLIANAEIEPETVSGFVPDDNIEYVARVQLTSLEQQRATTEAITKKPVVVFAPGQTRETSGTVSVTLLSRAVPLVARPVSANLGYVFSPNLQGKYEVELDPEQGDMEVPTVSINATDAATEAYVQKQTTFMLLLYILDEDPQETDWIERAVEFNFPQEFVRRGEIEAGDNPPIIRFRVVPMAPEAEEIIP